MSAQGTAYWERRLGLDKETEKVCRAKIEGGCECRKQKMEYAAMAGFDTTKHQRQNYRLEAYVMREQIMPLDDERPRKFGGTQVGAGRPLGALNRITKDIKQGFLDGILTCDYALDPTDKKAPGSISQYMRTVANKHPELFFSAVVRLIPKELHTSLRQESTLDITYENISQVKQALEESGMSRTQIAAIAALMPDTGKSLEADDVEEIFEKGWIMIRVLRRLKELKTELKRLAPAPVEQPKRLKLRRADILELQKQIERRRAATTP